MMIDLVRIVAEGTGLGDLVWPLIAVMLFALARVKLGSSVAVGVLALSMLGLALTVVETVPVKAGMVAAAAAVLAGVLARAAAGRG